MRDPPSTSTGARELGWLLRWPTPGASPAEGLSLGWTTLQVGQSEGLCPGRSQLAGPLLFHGWAAINSSQVLEGVAWEMAPACQELMRSDLQRLEQPGGKL